jgi:hypothetical protein
MIPIIINYARSAASYPRQFYYNDNQSKTVFMRCFNKHIIRIKFTRSSSNGQFFSKILMSFYKDRYYRSLIRDILE